MKKQKLIALDQADDDQLAVCAKHAGMDEMRNTWAPAFVYGDDTSAKTRAKVIEYLKKRGYTHVDISDADYIVPLKIAK